LLAYKLNKVCFQVNKKVRRIGAILLGVFAVTLDPRWPALAAFVAPLHYQQGELPVALERMLPTGHTYLLVNLHEDGFRTYSGPNFSAVEGAGGAVLPGPRSRSTVIDTQEQRCLVWMPFKIGGAAAFFGPPVDDPDQFFELDRLWGRDGAVLRERMLHARTPKAKLQILETVLLEQLNHSHQPDPATAVSIKRP
jgi:hypothetical protein